ncbi:hypothetical protein H8356DRAFT_1312162 [Neocallimastix lanati (nom. inval.)]|nr:hypothetical protein H8356DRAFT_1312162 [Neocallimastix sp. JGI-2020a]
MFSKKIISFIGLLIIGSRIKSVTSTALENCADDLNVSSCSGSTDHYCIKDSGIYGVTEGGACSAKIISEGIYVMEGNSKLISATDLADTTAASISGGTELTLWECTNENVCQKTYGYIKDITGSDPAYYYVSKSGSNTVSTVENCGSNVGKLKTADNNLCVTDSLDIGFGSEALYIMSNVQDNIFTGAATTSNSIIIKKMDNTITLNLVGESVHLYKENANVVVDVVSTDYTENAEKIAIYDCNKDSICTKTNGYAISSGSYYPVNGSGATAATNGETVTDANDANACSGKIGQLITSDGGTTKYLCLADDIKVLSSAEGEYVVIGTLANNNIFTGTNTENAMIPIKIANDYIILNKILDDQLYRKYGTNALEKRTDNFCSGTILDNLFTCTGGACTRGDNPVPAGEYLVEISGQEGKFQKYDCDPITQDCEPLTNENGLLLVETVAPSNQCDYQYHKVVTAASVENASNLKIYDCKAGVCQATSGMTTYGSTTPVYCTTGGCTTSGTELDLTSIITNGKLKYDSGYELDVESAKIFDITADGTNKYFYPVDTTHFVYLKTATNVVGVAIFSYIEDNTIIYYNNESNAAKYLVVTSDACTGSTVSKYTKSNNTTLKDAETCSAGPCSALAANNSGTCDEGYYVADDSFGDSGNLKTSGKLYHCETGKCEQLSKVGYFKNQNGAADSFISCDKNNDCQIAAVSGAEDCTNIDSGKLYKDTNDSDKIKLCVKKVAAVGIELKDESAGKYVVGVASNTFLGSDANAYVIVDLDATSVVKNVDDTILYRYTDTNSKIINRSNNSDMCTNHKSDISEYKKKSDASNEYNKTN